MNKAYITKLQKKYNITIYILNKFSGHYTHEIEIWDFENDKYPKLFLKSNQPIYKQIEAALNR